MTSNALITILTFLVGAYVLLFLLSRWLRMRGSKDESAGSQEHSVGWDSGSSDGGADGGGD